MQNNTNNLLHTIFFILIVNVLSACNSGISSQNNRIETNNINIDISNTDTQVPVITRIGEDVNISIGDTYVDAGATAKDNIDGNITKHIVITSNVNTAVIGTYTVHYDVKDKAGNSAEQITRVVNVREIPRVLLTISGKANRKTNIYDTYQFLPLTTNDVNHNSLTFSIENKPSWAEFNTTTGLLEGHPNISDEGNYTNIIITVSDGGETVNLAPFDIEVKPAIDIAHTYGKATQGTDRSYGYYGPASNAIDNNDSTYHHTRGGNNGENWLQIELPNPTKISKIVIQNLPGNSKRLTNAKVYVLDTPYTGSVDINDAVKTLEITTSEQIIDFDTPISGRYVLIKGETTSNDNRHLHLSKVEVYGALPNAPIFNNISGDYFVAESSTKGTLVRTIVAEDFQGDSLDYSIVDNVPFSIDNNGNIMVNGVLDYGYYTFDVVASDGMNSSSTSVTIKANQEGSPQNIAHKFGVATQSEDISYYYYRKPSNAIDNNLTTMNMTADAGWLQVALPKGTKVAKVVVRNRTDAVPDRLNGTKVYLGTKDFNGTIIERDYIGTLTGSTKPQIFTFDTLKNGDYVLLKENNDNLHVLEVEVYGVTPARPVFNAHTGSYLIPGATVVGTTVATIAAVDYQADNLTYSIVGIVPFSVDAQGHITVNGVLNASSYTFEVEVSDGENSTRTAVTINITSNTVIADVLASGDVVHTKVTEAELIQATLDEIESLRVGDSLLSEIYENNSISYATGNYSSQLINYYGDKGKIFPILYANKNNTLALAGTKGASRISIFASNPFYFFNRSKQLSYEPYMKRILAWLIANKPIDLTIKDSSKTIALSFASNASDVTSWFTTNYPNWTVKSCNDNATLATCYDNADLVILGNTGGDADALVLKSLLPTLLTAGKSLLYTHPNWGENSLSTVIEDVFEFSFPYGGNYWKNDSATWDSSTAMQSAFFDNSGYASINTMFNHFKEKDYDYDWSRCKDSKGVHGENNDNCSEVVGLNSEFQEGATVVRNLMNGLDSGKKNVFAKEGYHLQKLLALTADKFRQSVSYPMDKVTTDDNDFMKSFYADHAIYNYRSINPKQLDMGNFSRSDFSHITPTTRTVKVNSKKHFRSTGAYALPGQTVTMTRNDSSDLTVKVFINTLRAGATHQFQKNGYNRPKYLKTPYFEIKSGETITFTSPYGGTLQLNFSKNDLPVDITFSNVGEHAYWGSTADNISFAQKLDANEYEWAEIATAGFEVHSKLDKMVQSVSDTRWGGTAEGLAAAVVKYTSNYPHVLAGFKGEGVDVVPEIHDWAEEKGLTIETIDTMKHMNADQATCGYGCSGNPYDAYWAFNPIGHGDIHELGHRLQKMRFEGFPNHAATNTFSLYTKSRYFANTAGDNDCGGLPFKSFFEKIQASVGQSDVQAYLKTNLWDSAGLGVQYLLKIEAFMHAEKLGKLQNGWHVLARVHILEREMRRAKQDWNDKKASVGFSTYTLDEINSIGNNDWLIVAYSYASELDLRNYFTMTGIPFSQKAKDQIASFAFDVPANSLFISTDEGYCNKDDYGTLFDKPTLPMDGKTLYSY